MDVQLIVRLSAELNERLDTVCDKHGFSRSEITRRALTDIISKMEKTKTPLPARK